MKVKPLFKVTGVLTNGKRFKPVYTTSYMHATGINLYRGTVWYRENGKWRVLRREYN